MLEFARVPVASVAENYLADPVARECVLAGGDDYELCFTAPINKHDAVLTAGEKAGVAVTCIGRITTQRGLTVLDAQGQPLTITKTGYDHFAA